MQDVIVTNRLGSNIFLGKEDGTFREKKETDAIIKEKLESLLEMMKKDTEKTDDTRYIAPAKHN